MLVRLRRTVFEKYQQNLEGGHMPPLSLRRVKDEGFAKIHSRLKVIAA